MGSLVEEVKQKIDELINHAAEVKQAVDNVAANPTPEEVIVQSMVTALEAQGYTVTPPQPA